MIQMNIGDHIGNENGDVFRAIPPNQRGQVRWARRRLFVIARDLKRADNYFSSLPGGRTLTSLINDNSIWFNYDPTTPDYGWTYGNNDMWIGNLSFRWGRWTTLATIIHELAHINGAPAGNDHRAELALLECGLGRRSELRTGVDDPYTPYNPNTTG